MALASSQVSRRAILGILTTITLAGVAKAGSPLPRPRPKATEPLQSLLRLLEPARNSAKAIGRVYLVQTPDENDWQILVGRLLAESTISEHGMNGSRGLVTEFKHQCANDFSEGRIVLLDGWMLSRTEARLCAVHALIA
jgi:hypothetical protein